MLAGLPLAVPAVHGISIGLREGGADDLADGLDEAVYDDVKVFGLTVPKRALILAALEDPPPSSPNCAPVLLTEHQWHVEQRLG
jgi:hypothetical protein